jgi:hypothetical protein
MKRPEPSLEELQSTADRNVFVMMRYAGTAQFLAIEESIRSALGDYGLIARLAKDRALSDDLWENIRLYMATARYGIAVFEQIDRLDFNPNISLELGYMYALGRRCLLLKDKRMPHLPTDTCGKIYKDFDTYSAESSVSNQVRAWCEADLGLRRITSTSQAGLALQKSEHIVYDSSSDENFSKWGLFDTSRHFQDHIRLVSTHSESRPGTTPTLELRADGTEVVGANMKVDALHGAFVVEYYALSSSATALNLYLCVIPMKGSIDDLLEVGASVADEPENAFSPYRVRLFIPHHQIADNTWHTARVEFDFRQTPTASYSVCAARINEGCPRPGGGAMRIRNIRVLTTSG